MRKISKNISNIFVKKISEKKKNIFTKTELLNIWMRSGWVEYRFANALTLLKNATNFQKICQNLYFFGLENDLEQNYWTIIDKIIKEHCADGAILGGEKALEWRMFNQLPPEKLILYTRDFSFRMRIFDGREVHFRTLVSGERTGAKNLFPILKKYSQKDTNFRNIWFPNRELALLEALSVREKMLETNEVLLFQFLQRNSEKLDFDILAHLVTFRYIRAVNRLRSFAKEKNFENLYQKTLQIIKKEWAGCFLSI